MSVSVVASWNASFKESEQMGQRDPTRPDKMPAVSDGSCGSGLMTRTFFAICCGFGHAEALRIRCEELLYNKSTTNSQQIDQWSLSLNDDSESSRQTDRQTNDDDSSTLSGSGAGNSSQ